MNEKKRQEKNQRISRQEEHCANLRIMLAELKKAREEREFEERSKAEKEAIFRQKQKLLKEEMKLRKQQEAMERLRDFRKRADEKLSEEKKKLAEELRIETRRKRERALQDYIRVNFRRVLAEKRKQEKGKLTKIPCSDDWWETLDRDSLPTIHSLWWDNNTDS